MMPTLLHHLVDVAAARSPEAIALRQDDRSLDYAALANLQDRMAGALASIDGIEGARVSILVAKSFEFVIAAFGASKACAIFVPINPLLKPHQVAHILRDSGTKVLVVSADRYRLMAHEIHQTTSITHIVVTGRYDGPAEIGDTAVLTWQQFLERSPIRTRLGCDNDPAAIFYTSGSTGNPKGVVLSHRNLVSGAASVADYLENGPHDRILGVLPFSFDAGFSQLTTAFHVGARVVLQNYLLPGDILRTIQREKITGLTAVPPLYVQLAELDWPPEVGGHFRYFASTGGRMPREVLSRLRAQIPSAVPYLMYGLTEAFRSTYLPPSEIDRRPDSIGKAIPNQEILVLDKFNRPCRAGEHGQLVHRGSTVALGYWNDPERTAERFRALPRSEGTWMLPEIAVYSGDIVCRDEDGYLYFIGRDDDMIKSNGYRISPSEVEEVAYDSGLVNEVAAFGIPDARLGQVVALVVVTDRPPNDVQPALLEAFRARLPAYMAPQRFLFVEERLPRSPNGKIDRRTIAAGLAGEPH